MTQYILKVVVDLKRNENITFYFIKKSTVGGINEALAV